MPFKVIGNTCFGFFLLALTPMDIGKFLKPILDQSNRLKYAWDMVAHEKVKANIPKVTVSSIRLCIVHNLGILYAGRQCHSILILLMLLYCVLGSHLKSPLPHLLVVFCLCLYQINEKIVLP